MDISVAGFFELVTEELVTEELVTEELVTVSSPSAYRRL
jgi:hypothetical protein